MKKLFTIIIFMASFSSSIYSQNLVPNPSFEDYTACPDNDNQVEYATGWSNFSRYGLTPDYHNSCSSNPRYSVPYNWGGYQQAATGNAYCAVGSNYGPSSDSVPREFIGIMLSAPLEIGKKYIVSFKASLAIINEWPNPYWNCSANKLGILFSTVIYNSDNPINFKNYAHIYTDSIISDTLDWTVISGNFIADSSYEHIILGNFFDNSQTDTIRIYDHPFDINKCQAYYYIDDISVIKDSTDATGIYTELLEQSIFTVFPNPFSQKTILNISSNIEKTISICIYDIYGRIIKTINPISNKNIEIHRENLSVGIYFLSVSFNNNIYQQKLIITD